MSIYMILPMPQTAHSPTIRRRSLTGRLRKRASEYGLIALIALAAGIPIAGQSPGSIPVPAVTPPQGLDAAAPAARQDKTRARNALLAGRRAEQTGDWNAEFAAYTEAARFDPSNREYSVLKEHARFQVVQSLVDNAERKEIAGDTPAARALLNHALEIDPNYVVARERLEELAPEDVAAGPADGGAQNVPRGQRFAGLPRLTLKPGTRSFDYRGTVRGAYGEIANQYGFKVIFDVDLSDRPVRFQAPAVDFDAALMILSRQTKTFTRVVDAHTLFVTDDNPQKEREYALEVSKELVLPSSVGSDEMNEVVRMIREMTGITRTQLNTATHTLTVRSTEQNVALADAILKQVEQPHGELMLEIDILELDRSTATQLGVTPPASSSLMMLTVPEIQQLEAANNSGTLLQTLQSIFGSSVISSATGAALPALIAFGGGNTIFLSTLPDVSANFGAAVSNVQSAQRVLLRAQDGKPATFFVGDRYPISLGLLSADINPTSSTLSTAATAALASGLSLPRNDYNVGQAPVAVAIADFNEDGKPDLAVANQKDGTITILEGNGDGTFTVPSSTACSDTPRTFPACVQLPATKSGLSSTAASPSALTTGTLVQGGHISIAVTDQANDQVFILIGNGDGTFQTPVAYPTGTAPVALVAQDFDGDGSPDLAVVNQGNGTTPGNVSILLGNKPAGAQDGTFGTQVSYDVGVSPSAIATGTFVANGFTSLAVTNKADSTVSILIGQGMTNVPDGTFATQVTSATGASPAGVAVGDFNNDGKPDLAVTYATDTANNSVSILLGNGDGTFGTAKNFPAGSGPVGIVADAFAGTNTDLAVADETGNNVDVLIGNGDGTFATPISLPTGNAPIALATADVNGDGTLDLVSANNSSNTVTVTLNTIQSSTGSSNAPQTAYPSAEYEDLGLKVKATPHLHAGDEVTLQLQFDIKALTGQSINGIPILSNRNIEQTIRLHENETSVLSGILQSSDLGSTSGLPWTSTAPGIGLLTGEDTTNIQKTELLFLVTPRALRMPPREAQAIYAGRGEPNTPPSGPAPVAPVAPGVPPQAPAGTPNPVQPREGERGPFGGAVPPNQVPGQPGQPPQLQAPPPQQPPQTQPPEEQQRPLPQQQ